MAIFASTTTSGYSDPLKAMTIKALEARQKDLLAQQAADKPDAAMMATIPGGIGHVLGVVGDQMKQGRADAALAAQKETLARTMAGVDWDKGPTAQQVAVMNSADPELARQALTTLAENRRAAAANATTARGQDVTARGQDVVAGTTARGQDVVAGTAARGQDITARGQDVTARGQDIVSADTQRGQDITTRGQDITTRGQDIVSADTQRGQDVTSRGQDVVAGTTARGQDVTARGQDVVAGTTTRGQDIGATTATRGQDVQARGQDIGAGTAERGQDIGATTATRGQDVTARGQDIGAGTAERGQDITQRGQDITARGQDIETADRAAKLASDERIAAEKVAAKAAEQASDPKRAAAVAEIGTKYIQQSQAADKLEKALHILDNGGINTGPWARAETVAANLTNGKFGGSKEMAQRTTDFNSIVNEHAIKQMSETLKGQSTDFEMTKFLEVLNNPNASPEQRREALVNMISAAKTARDLHAEAVRKVGGNLDMINQGIGKGGGGGGAGGVVGGITEEEAMKLPPNTKFRLKDGRTGTTE